MNAKVKIKPPLDEFEVSPESFPRRAKHVIAWQNNTPLVAHAAPPGKYPSVPASSALALEPAIWSQLANLAIFWQFWQC